MKKISETLRAAKQLLSDPNVWTTGALARNRIQSPVLPTSTQACRWCAVGAVLKIVGPEVVAIESERALYYLRAATKQFGFGGGVGTPATMNDKSKHETIMKLFDAAIQAAEADGK